MFTMFNVHSLDELQNQFSAFSEDEILSVGNNQSPYYFLVTQVSWIMISKMIKFSSSSSPCSPSSSIYYHNDGDHHHQSYRGVHPNSNIGQPGKLQGFNTGVSVYLIMMTTIMKTIKLMMMRKNKTIIRMGLMLLAHSYQEKLTSPKTPLVWN